MRKLAFATLVLLSLGAALVATWLRNPRIGSGRMNRIVNPIILRRGLAGGGASELGMLEHVGRASGTRRLTPVRPVPTPDGFRIVVPLGLKSQWAQNVVAAGHCRLQVHDTVYDLDEPALVTPGSMAELAAPVRALTGSLGMLYLRLHTFAQHPGTLETVQDAAAGEPVRPAPEPAAPAPEPATAG